MDYNNKSVLKENVDHGNQMLPLKVYHTILEQGIHDLYLHWHNEMEFIYIKSGKGIFEINLKSYEVSAGDLLIINKGSIHSGIGIKGIGCECLTIVFDLNMLQSFMLDSCQAKYITPIVNDEVDFIVTINKLSNGYEKIIETILELINLYFQNNYGYELEVKGLIYILIAQLFRNEHISKKKKISNINERKLGKIKEVLQFIEKNYKEQISIKELSEVANYSEYHFIRFFKSEIGMTCTEYINLFRVSKAADLLLNTSLSVTNVALEVGFENISYFIKKFKERYNISPSKYRKDLINNKNNAFY